VTTNDSKALQVWGQWPQADGGTRYALSAPADARRNARALRDNPVLADALRADVVVERSTDGRLTALDWPCRSEGRDAPWAAILDAVPSR